MDGRAQARFGAAFTFLAAFVGCQSTEKTPAGPSLSQLPKTKTVMPEAGQATVARAVSTVSDPKKKEPVKAATFVAVGHYRSELSENPELSFAEAEQVRSQARQAYNDALKADPKCIPAYIGLAKSYIAIEDAQQALGMYDKALRVVPNDATLWYEKGLTHARFKDFDGALESMEHARKLDPDNRMYRRMIGMTLARAGRLDDALAALKTCMKPEEAAYTIARMCKHMDRPDLAREYLAASVKAHPTFMPAHHMMTELNQPAGGQNLITTVGHQEPGKTAASPSVHVGGIE